VAAPGQRIVLYAKECSGYAIVANGLVKAPIVPSGVSCWAIRPGERTNQAKPHAGPQRTRLELEAEADAAEAEALAAEARVRAIRLRREVEAKAKQAANPQSSKPPEVQQHPNPPDS
jgi:hypothetical protein